MRPWAPRPDHRHAHGQVHRDDAGPDRPDRHDGQGRARPRGHRSHQEAQVGLPHGRGGAAYLVSKAIKTAKVVGFEDLGMEAIYEFEVVDMPVTVAVDSGGTSAHITGPAEWQSASPRGVQGH